MLQDYTPKDVSALMEVVDTYMRHKDQVVNKGKRKYEHYHPSEWGKCLRQQQYKHYEHKGYVEGKETAFDGRMLRLFDKGHNMHNRWSRYFEEIGILRGRWRCSNRGCRLFNDDGQIQSYDQNKLKDIYARGGRIYGNRNKLGIFKPDKCVCGCSFFEYEETPVVSKDLNMHGHCDLIIDCSNFNEDVFKGVRQTFNFKYLPTKGQKVVGDMKTISSKAWKNQIESKGAHKYYLIQLCCYTHILGCDYGLLMYENKDDSHMKWYKVERNDEWWDAIQWQAKTMIQMANAKDEKGQLTPKLPPPRPLSRNDYECKNCSYKAICHSSGIWDSPDLSMIQKDFYKCLL